MFKQTLVAFALTAILFPSMSKGKEPNKIVVGLGYTQLFIEDKDIGLSVSGVGLGGVGASFGYRININNMYLLPEFRMAFGSVDQTWDYSNSDWKLELDSYIALSLQAGTEFGKGFAFLSTSFTNIDTTLTRTTNSVSIPVQTKENKFGIGAGIGYRFNEYLSIDFAAEYLDSGLYYTGLNLKTYLSIY